MANKKVNQLTSKPAVNLTDLFLIADPTSGQAFKTTISDLGTAIGSGVSSVNTLVGAVVLDTDDIQELASPTNKWFTDTRARAALSASSPLAYNSGTGAFSIQVANGSQNGYLSSTDWTTFNAKQAALSGTGFVKISGTTISYDNSTYALDSAVVKLTGNQTIAGTKTFSDSPLINVDLGFKTPSAVYTYLSAFNAGWNFGMTSGINHSFYFGSTTARSYTFPNADGTVALTSNLSSYLPLSGGTLTGALSGTSATFSSTLTLSNGELLSSSTLKLGANSTTIYLRPNGVNNSTGQLSIDNSGAATFSSSVTANGVKFNGGSSTLNYYEEGSFTPSLRFGGNNVGMSYFDTNGQYTRIGRQVTCTLYLALTAKGSSSGVAQIYNLPFTSGSSTRGYITAGSIRFDNITYSGTLTVRIDPGNSTISFQQTSVLGVDTDLTNTNFNDSTEMAVTISYFV